MFILLLTTFVAIAIPIIVIIMTLFLYARSGKKHAKEYYWKKTAPWLVTIVIGACVLTIIVMTYLLFISGVAMN